MEMWQFVLYLLVLPVVISAAYVIRRDRRHPLGHPTHADEEWWRHVLPR